VSSRVITTRAVGLISGGVVQGKTGDGEMLAASNVEAVDGPVHNVKIRDLGVVGILNNDEVVGPRNISRCP
jgi:hypothetical protein